MAIEFGVRESDAANYRFWNRAALAVAVLVAIGVSIWVESRMSALVDNQWSSNCNNHLRSCGGALMRIEARDGALPAIRDVKALLSLYRDGALVVHSPGIFVCQADDAAVACDVAEAAYADADLLDPEFISTHFSYAIRDMERFPLEEGRRDIIMCDRQGLDGRTPHHPDGLNVLFDDGAVQFKDREWLGLAPDDPIVVGPESTHPELRKMIFLHSA